jgi:hypothetical protein
MTVRISIEDRRDYQRRETRQPRPRVLKLEDLQDFPGLTPEDCFCGKCIRGVSVSDCSACACVNTTRRTSLPDMQTPDFEDWDAPSEIVNLKYQAECVWTSDIIDGPTCIIGEGEEEEEVHDQYQLFVNYATGIAELKCITETPQCDVIYVKWEFCPDCAKKCLCVWRFELVEFTNVIIAPEQCKICVTPVRARPVGTTLPCSTCSGTFAIPGEVQMRIFDHPVPSTRLCGDGDVGVTIPADYTAVTHNGKHLLTSPATRQDLWLAADYELTLGDSWADTIFERIQVLQDDAARPLMCETVWATQYVRPACEAAPPCPAVEGEIPGQVVHWVWGWLQETSLGSGDWYIWGYIKAGEASSEMCGYFMEAFFRSADTYTCEELAALVPDPDSEIEAEEVELVFTSGSRGADEITEPLPSIWFSFQIPDDQDASDNDGKTGKACGPPEEEPCSKPCVVRVQTVSIGGVPTKTWVVKRSKGCGSTFCTCEGMTSYYCGGAVTSLSGIGNAADFDEGTERRVPCVATPANVISCDSAPASLNVTIGEATGTLSPPASNTIGITCDGESVSMELTYSCTAGCPTLQYDIAPGCPGTAVLESVVSADPLDVTFSIPAGVCCAESFSIHITE